MCEQWVRNEQIDGADPLQAWAVDHAQVAWHTGIGTIEAAQVWADTPEEGVAHEDREDAYPQDVGGADRSGQERPA
ncbi:hypothetical protein LJR175_008397 [Variovorax sp. LjRoot175]|uniref:hypothetical protein n=1 Tax=Variovorax sp. LjRoot175 TaxID=3342276 RepID=UPI003ED12250